MKNSAQITGLPIISITDGIQVGKVKSLVINPDKGTVDFLTIELDDWQVSVKAIPFKKVIGIGEFAVTIESESAIIDLNEIPIANQLVNKKIKILNTRVMTRKGELIGEIEEFYVDEENGLILGMVLKAAGKEVALSSEFVLTYGKDIIIVKEDAPSHFLDSAEDLDPARKKTEAAEAAKEDDPISALLPETNEVTEESAVAAEHDDVSAAAQRKEADPITELFPEIEKEAEENSIEVVEDEELTSLKRKQIDLLKGKKLTKTIYSTNGQVLLEAGIVLTPEDIAKAQEDGPSTVVELSMNVEE